MTNKIIVFAALAVSLMLTACNTVRGVGQDVQGAGSAIERSADR